MFAEFYSKKFGGLKSDFMKILWGDWFLGETDGKPTRKPSSKRIFNEYIYKPIKNLYDAVCEDNSEKYNKILKRFDFELNTEEKELSKSDLYKKLFKRIYPLAPVIKKLFVNHLPSPLHKTL